MARSNLGKFYPDKGLLSGPSNNQVPDPSQCIYKGRSSNQGDRLTEVLDADLAVTFSAEPAVFLE